MEKKGVAAEGEVRISVPKHLLEPVPSISARQPCLRGNEL